MRWAKTIYHRGQDAYHGVEVPWEDVNRFLGHEYQGDLGDDKAITERLLQEGAPAWIKVSSEGWEDEYGYGIIGPEWARRILSPEELTRGCRECEFGDVTGEGGAVHENPFCMVATCPHAISVQEFEEFIEYLDKSGYKGVMIQAPGVLALGIEGLDVQTLRNLIASFLKKRCGEGG